MPGRFSRKRELCKEAVEMVVVVVVVVVVHVHHLEVLGWISLIFFFDK
jgi:hypothetical protein